MVCSLAASLVLQLILLIACGLLQRLALLIVHLAISVARHDWALLSEVSTTLLRGCLDLAALSAPLVVLEMMDLLVLRVSRAYSLLSISHAVL